MVNYAAYFGAGTIWFHWKMIDWSSERDVVQFVVFKLCFSFSFFFFFTKQVVEYVVSERTPLYFQEQIFCRRLPLCLSQYLIGMIIGHNSHKLYTLAVSWKTQDPALQSLW